MKEYFGYSLYSFYDMEKDLVDSKVMIMIALMMVMMMMKMASMIMKIMMVLIYPLDDDDLDDNGGADVYLYHHKVRLEQPDSGLTEFWSGDILPTSAAPKSDH